MTFPTNNFHEDSDADDEFERSILTSPTLPTDDEETSADDSEAHSPDHTPTFQNPDAQAAAAAAAADLASPRTIISAWTTDECAAFVSTLGLPQYCEAFLENEIVGEALIALGHEELREMGVSSVGHRLTILKGVYDVKTKQNIAVESDHYIPPSAEASIQNKRATQDDISRIIQCLRLRDEKILHYESELRRMGDDYRRLREELLPVFRMAKERSQPLPDHASSPDFYHERHHDGALSSPILQQPPFDKHSGGLARKISHKGKSLWLNSTPKNASPTYMNHSIPEGATASVNSPNPASLPSPTSPNSYHGQPRTYATPGGSRNDASDRTGPSTGRSAYGYGNDDAPNFGYPSSAASTLVSDGTYRSNNTSTPGRGPPGRSATNGTSTRDQDDSPAFSGRLGGAGPSTGGSSNGGSGPLTGTSSGGVSAGGPSTGGSGSGGGGSGGGGGGGGGSGGGGSSDAPGVEIFKSFRVSMDDPCYKVLPAALRKYNINADWRQYALYIVFGDQERCLGLEEKPLILFKQLDKEGRKPMFMLRKHAAPIEGHSGPTSSSLAGGFDGSGNANAGGGSSSVGGPGNGGGGGGSGSGGGGPSTALNLPGGVL